MPGSWRDRLSDPWFVLPIGILLGAVVALSLAIVLEPAAATVEKSVIAAGVTPYSAVASPSPAAGSAARDRDLLRAADAYQIARASFQYYNEHGSYPAGSGVQPLCVDRSADAGCGFESYLGQIPFDPRGDPAANGYWYQSNGTSYMLFMSMERGEGLDEAACPAPRPNELAGVAHLFCVNMGPPTP